MADIRQYINLVESMERKIDPVHVKIIDEIFITNPELTEGVLGDLKDKVVSKAKNWADKIKKVSGDAMPALQAKYDQVISQLEIKDKDAAKQVETEMKKQAGSKWMSNAGKVAAALAVASSLLAASTTSAAAGDRGRQQHYAQPQYHQQYAPQQYRHQYAPPQHHQAYNKLTPHYPYDPNAYNYGYGYQGHHHGGAQASDVIVGALVGAALGAIIGANARE